MRVIGLLIIIFFGTGISLAQTPDTKNLDETLRILKETEDKAKALKQDQLSVKQEIKKIKTELVKLASETDLYEKKQDDLTQSLAHLHKQTQNIEAEIQKNRQTSMRLLGALRRISHNPPPTLLMSSGHAIEAAQTSRLVSGVQHALQKRTDHLFEQHNMLANLKSQTETEKEKGLINQQELINRRKALQTTAKQKSILEQSIEEQHRSTVSRAANLAQEAKTLRALIEKFEQSANAVTPRLKPQAPSPAISGDVTPHIKPINPAPSQTASPSPIQSLGFSQAKGRLKAPVNGRIKRRYSAQRKGMTVATASEAKVISPYSAYIEFAGTFKNFDQVVILNMGDGYFILMTGLGQVFVEAGENVLAGEPLGLMSFNPKAGSELYIEFRKDGRTINPNPWLGTAFASTG